MNNSNKARFCPAVPSNGYSHSKMYDASFIDNILLANTNLHHYLEHGEENNSDAATSEDATTSKRGIVGKFWASVPHLK